MQQEYVLSQIFIYPIKSLGGMQVNEATVELRGLRHDRRWLLVDENNRFLTQRTFAEMALLQVHLEPNGLLVSHKMNIIPPILIPYKPKTSNIFTVQIWDDFVPAIEVAAEATTWFTAALDRFCRLVYMPEPTQRQADLNYAAPGEFVSFADSFPVLLIGQASLDDLNSRLPEPVPMNRFRPNLVFTGGDPFIEDTWVQFTIADCEFKGVKLCARCILITIDQDTTLKSQEPLRTLANYRKPVGTNKVNFGQNVIPVTVNKTIKVGDFIQVQQSSQ